MDALACPTTLSRPSLVRRRCTGSDDRPRLSIVIVNYQHWEDTVQLVQQLRHSCALREGEAEILIIDNHSPRHRLLRWLRGASGVSVRRWKHNRGFARAVNEGVRLSQGDWVLLLNPDTTVSPGFVDELLDRLDSYSTNAGVIGYQLRNSDGSPQLSTGLFPRFAATLARLLLPRAVRKYSEPSQRERPSEVDWVTGCCLLARRKCLLDLDGLDDAFFLYYEDVDLCLRAREHGWSVWFDPTLSIVHHRPLHAREVPPHLRAITRHALLTYAQKHWPTWQVPLLGSLMCAEAQYRRLLAWCQRNREAQETFAELLDLLQAFLRGQAAEAQTRLRRIVRRQESHYASLSLHRHSQPQPSRPVPTLSTECAATHARRHAGSRGR